MISTLGCGPYFSPGFIIGSILVLSLVKLPLYVLFILSFRYRVSTPAPLSTSKVFEVAILRAVAGLLVLGTIAFFMTGGSALGDGRVAWAILLAERAVLWFGAGLLCSLRSRRLWGFTISGVGIDAACDLIVAGALGGLSLLGSREVLGLGFLAFVVFLTPLFVIGRRPSLKSRFFAKNLCRTCGYDMTGNTTGTCPECGVSFAGSRLSA